MYRDGCVHNMTWMYYSDGCSEKEWGRSAEWIRMQPILGIDEVA